MSFYTTPNTYTVTLDPNGGSGGTSSVTATYGAAMPSASMPTRTGYAFNGYWDDAAGHDWASPITYKQYYTAAGASASYWDLAFNLTLYAGWDPNTYAVKFNANGGTGTMANESFTYDKAKALTTNAFTRTGYTFKGWATTSGATSAAYTNGQSVSNLTATANGTVNLYAVWTANTYAVKFNANGGTGTMANESFTYGTAKALTANAFTRTGYTFKGWATTSGATSAAYTNGQSVSNLTATANGTVNLYAVWTARKYDLVVNPNEGAYGGDTGPSTIHNGLETGTSHSSGLAVSSRSGYTFAGYYDAAEGGNQTHSSSGAASSSAAAVNGVYWNGSGGTAKFKGLANASATSLTVYARWTPNKYTITFDANGGSVSPATKSVTYASTYGNLPTPTLADHSFVGWFTAQSGGEQVTSSTSVSITGNQTLYARWAQESYEVWFRAFDKNGEVIGGSFQTITMGENAYLKSFNTLAITPPDGYSFTNWNTAMDGSGVSHEDHENVFNLTNVANATVTLYAQWSPNPYEVKFLPNGADGGETMDNQAFTYDVTQALDHVEFNYTGYAFKGWSTTTNRPSSFIADGAEVVNLATGGVVNLYANWTGVVYTVTFDANGGSGEMNPLTCTYDVPTNLPACTFTCDGWGFKEWTNAVGEAFADHARVTNLTATAETTLFACWTGVTYTVTLDASRDSRGVGLMTNDNGEAVSVLTRSCTVGDAWNLPTPTNVNENLTFAGWKYGDNQTAGGEVPPPSSGSTNLVAEWAWVTDDLAAAVDASELGFRTFGTVGNKGKPNESEYSANWFAQRNCFFNDGVSTNAVQSGALPANTEDSKVYVSWLTTMVETNGVLSFWWKCDAKPLIEAPYQQYELKPGWCGDSFTFGLYDSTDGITNIVAQLTNHVDWTQVVYTNNSDSAVMLAWAFAYADDGRNNGGGTGWVDRVTWTQDGGAAGEATPMYGVPYSWLRANFPAYASADADTLNALGDGDSPIGKEMQVWQDYMAGTNPNDLNDLFRANIVVSNDMAHITWRPDLSVTGEPKRVYHVWGSSVLPAEWGIVQSNVVKELEVEMSAPGGSGVPARRFFKVEVNWEESQKKN